MPSSSSIQQAFRGAGRLLRPDACARIADCIGAHGSLELALAALANAEDASFLSDLLSYQAALTENADPTRRISRLRMEAEDLDRRAEPSWAEAADLHGRAAYRRLRGEHALAAEFETTALAAERLAAALEADAFAKRLEVAALQASAQMREEFGDLLEALAA